MKNQSRRSLSRRIATAVPAFISVGALAAATHATCHLDTDLDSVPDPYDNCVFESNPDQIDSNRDGVGNRCDTDYDQDGDTDIFDFGIFISSLSGSLPSGDTDHDGDGATTLLDFGKFLGDLSVSGFEESGLACVTGPAGGPIPCEFEAYDEIEVSGTADVVQLPQNLSPVLGGIREDGTLFVLQSPGSELLAADEVLDFAGDGAFDITGPFSTAAVTAGSEITRWIFHAQPVFPSDPVLPAGATVEFATTEEVLGVRLLGVGGASALDFDGPDTVEINGQSVRIDAPTPGIQLEVLTSCAPETGVTMSIDGTSASVGGAARFPSGAVVDAHDLLTVGVGGSPGPNPPDPKAMSPILRLGEMIDGGVFTGGAGANVDALSFGRDRGPILWFSVNERSGGIASGPAPDVNSEGMFGNFEAAADVFEWDGALPGLGSGVFGNTALYDGTGSVTLGEEGLGLDETSVGFGPFRTYTGDDLDAFDGDTTADDLDGNIFLSFDSASAVALGFSGADVVLSQPGEPLITYATPFDLGLAAAGDDIDALAIREKETTSPTFDPLLDGIHFSLRRGSVSIGMLDCRFGLPIEPGDVLTTPCAPGSPPAIGVRAEDLGLRTVRSGLVAADELDALDRVPTPLTREGEDPNPGGDDPNPGGNE